MYNTNVWLTLVIAALNLVLGLFVLARNPKKALYISFFFFSFITAACVFWVALSLRAGNLGAHLGYFFGALLLPSAIVWIDYLNPKTSSLKRKITIMTIGLIVAIVSAASGLVLKSIDPISLEISPGPLFDLYGLIILALGGYCLYRLMVGLKHSTGIKRTQYQYILIGAGGFILTGIVVNLVVPIFGNMTFTFADAQSSLFFIVFAAIAIIRYRFMDIRVIAARSLAYFLLIAIFLFFYVAGILLLMKFFLEDFSQINTFQWGIVLSFSMIMTICFNPLRLLITKATDKVFFRNLYNVEEIIDEINHIFSDTVELSDVMEKTIQVLSEKIGITNIYIAAFAERSVAGSKYLGFNKPIKADYKDLEKISQLGVKIFEEVEEQAEYRKIFEHYEATVSIPLKTEAKTVGLILVGDKKSGDMFSTRDIRLFNIISPEISINLDLRMNVKKIMQRLEDANNQLRELDEAKAEFMDIVAHNLRTPVTVIKGYFSLILDPSNKLLTKEEIISNVNEAKVGTEKLSVLVEDIVLATSILNKTAKPILSEITPKEIVEQIIKKYDKQIKDKKLDIKIDVGQHPVIAEEKDFRKVFENLIDNAIKFNEVNGKITITSAVNKDKNEIVFSVTDTGIGIPKNKQSNLFDRFSKTDFYTYDYEGIGLGLYLTNLIVRKSGGQISFKSDEGKGSTFTFSIPERTKKQVIDSSPVLVTK